MVSYGLLRVRKPVLAGSKVDIFATYADVFVETSEGFYLCRICAREASVTRGAAPDAISVITSATRAGIDVREETAALLERNCAAANRKRSATMQRKHAAKRAAGGAGAGAGADAGASASESKDGDEEDEEVEVEVEPIPSSEEQALYAHGEQLLAVQDEDSETAT